MMKTVAKTLIVLGLVVPFLVTVKHMASNSQLHVSGSDQTVVESAIADSMSSIMTWTEVGLVSLAVGVLMYFLSRRRSGPT